MEFWLDEFCDDNVSHRRNALLGAILSLSLSLHLHTHTHTHTH
ncbi:hypothetical protein OAV88_00310 [bacterium]|nr:hypothetical protein [bacterium]